MINHARTLLLNEDGASRPGVDHFLEEFVPVDYRVVSLPTHLLSIRNILFGVNPANGFKNFRLAQYMPLLHSTEFGDYVVALDSRVTYLIDHGIEQDVSLGVPARPVVEAIGAADQFALSFIGNLNPLAETPRIWETWDIEVLDASHVRILKHIDGSQEDFSVLFQSGLSVPIPLVGIDDLSFRIIEPLPAVGEGWTVTAWRRLDADLVGLIGELENLGEAVRAKLFSNDEPYKTFNELWTKHNYLSYRLSGILLAVIYRTEEIRLNGGR